MSAPSRLPEVRRAAERTLMRDWLDALQEFHAVSVLVLGPVPFAANDDREVIAVYPDDYRTPANGLARSPAYGAGWRESGASLVAWTNLPSVPSEADAWMQAWLERGALALVRAELPMPFGNGFECFTFTSRPLAGRLEAASIAWSALSVWPSLKDAFIAERFDISRRERQILLLLSRGLTSRGASEEVGVSERTINYHISNLMEKLHADNRTAVVQRACSLGLI